MKNIKISFEPYLKQQDLKPCKGHVWRSYINNEIWCYKDRTCNNCVRFEVNSESGKCLGVTGWMWIKLLMETFENDTIE